MAQGNFLCSRVIRACHSRIAAIHEHRKIALEKAINENINKMRFSFMKMRMVKRYKNRDEVITMLKKQESHSFFTAYEFITMAGHRIEHEVRAILVLAAKADGEYIMLTAEEVDLIKTHFDRIKNYGEYILKDRP